MVLSLFSDVDDDRRALISVERNIANIERSLSASTTGNGGGGGGGNGETLLTASLTDGAVVRNHHSDAARGLGKLFAGGRSSSMGRDSRITQTIIISLRSILRRVHLYSNFRFSHLLRLNLLVLTILATFPRLYLGA